MLNVKPLEERDYELIKAKRRSNRKNYRYERHHIGVIRTKTGKVFAAVHVEANIGRITVCAEAMALSKSISEGEHNFETFVAVAHPHPHENIENCWVVPPCGMCRELISDYGKETEVILPYNGKS